MAKMGQVEALMKKAENALFKKNYELAIYSYIQALAVQPDDTAVRLNLRAVQTRNAKENGTKKFKMYVAMVKANILKMMKKLDDAILACEHGLTADPSNMQLLFMVADLCHEAGHLEAAIWQRQNIADTIAGDDTVNLWALEELYKEAGRAQEAIGCLNRIHDIDPEEDVDAEIREVSAQLSSTIFARAAKEGSRAVLADKDEADKFELDPSKLKNDDQRRKAIGYRQEQDLKERPNDYVIWITIGDIAAAFDDFESGYKEAKKYYEKAFELSPANSAIRDKLGDLEMKKFRLTIELLNGKAKAGDEQAKAELAKVRKADLEFRLGEYERRVKDQPMKAEFHNQLGQIYQIFKRYDEAIGELQQAGKDPRFKIPALTNIGRCMLAQNNPQMAIKQFERARMGVEIYEKFREPMYYEAVAYHAMGDKDSLRKAQELFTTLYEIDIKFRDVKDRVEAIQAQLSA